MIKAFLFDLDGVLTDTSEYHYQAWQRLADEEGLPFTRQDNEALRGIGRRESLLLLLKGKPLPEPILQAWMERKNRYYLELVEKMTPGDLLPGVPRLLAELRSEGMRLVVASASKNAPQVLRRLELGPLLDAVVDGNTVGRSKPAPDLFLAAAGAVGARPEECVVVEDAAAGVQAGLAAGMHTLGIGPCDRVGGAERVLPDLSNAHARELLGWFNAG